jgi:siroheme synthase-like protein
MSGGPFALPIFLEVRGRTVFVACGGHEASAKARTLSGLGALVRAWSPALEGTESLDEVDGVTRTSGRFRRSHLDGAILAIVGTGDRALDHRVAAAARAHGVLVNTVDDIPWCDWSAPAILRRGDLTVAIGTGGAAPALAVRLRDRLADELVGPEFADLVELFAEVRPRVMATGRSFGDRRALWYDLVDGPALEHLRARRRDAAREVLAGAISEWEAVP